MNFRKKVKLRISEFCMLCRLFLGCILSCFYRKEDIWLLSERGHEARDNAYYFFLYLKRNHPELKVKYIISFDSKDLSRLDQYRDDLIEFASMEHYITIFRSKFLISTHVAGYTPHLAFFTKLDSLYNVFRNHKRVFLQHGITVNDMPQYYAEKTHLDLVISGAKPECEYLKSQFHYKEGQVQYTGFCRYDNLNDVQSKRQILLMPTWRQFIRDLKFEETDYFNKYKELLSNPRLYALLETYDYELVFYPHYEIQQFIKSFKDLSLSSRIYIADFDYDVQTLLKESAILITDYSSVFLDVAYMRKPIIFYQFDKDLFYSKHYKKGYLDANRLGEVALDIQNVLVALENALKSGCEMKNDCLSYANAFFEYRDTHNCDRVFNAINSL